MKSYNLTVSSPDGKLFEGEAVCLSVRGLQGDLAVMAGHIPFVTALKACEMVIDLPDETDKRGKIEGGSLTVGEDKVTLLTGSVIWS